MQQIIKFIFPVLIVVVSTPLFLSAQNSSPNFIEKDPAQYGVPFKNVPDKRDVSLYQVNMRVFSKQGDFKGVLSRLDSIKALGINVIYLMPIHPVGIVKTSNSPYCVKDYKAINAEFGSIKELREIVEGAHKRKMAIILDWVANHTAFDNKWTVNKEWYQQDSAGNIVSPAMGWNDVAQLNFNNAAMRLAMISAMKYWVYAANVDGYRCDYADGPPLDFWKQAIDSLRHIASHKLLFMAEGSRSENFNAGFDFNFGFRFFDDLKNIYAANRNVLSIDTLNKEDYKNATNGQQIIRYITNHDVNSSDGTPLELFGGVKGSLAAFTIVACMKGVPMIYGGQEVGTPIRLSFPFTSTKIDWTINPGLTAIYKKIIGFRNSSPVIRRGTLTSFSTPDICVFTKVLGKQKVLVLSNLRNASISYSIPSALNATRWTDVLNLHRIKISKTIMLQPYSYLILRQ